MSLTYYIIDNFKRFLECLIFINHFSNTTFQFLLNIYKKVKNKILKIFIDLYGKLYLFLPGTFFFF